ncbi:MAG: hypothetical protein HKO68_12990 [Desulfobacterales bacterium]|nr:hypothetical protein [Desulfobacterales bacterium]
MKYKICFMKFINAQVKICLGITGNCHEDPSYLEDIVRRKSEENRPELITVVLLAGARYIHPDDSKIGRYIYPDRRERMNWKNSQEYGPQAE